MAFRVRQPRLPIATFLSVVLVILVAAPMLLVGALGLGTAASNTSRLLNERSQLFRDQMVTRTRDFLAPAQALPGFVAERMELGELDAAEPGPVSQALRYAFGAAPQLSSVAFASDAGWVVAAYREADGQVGTNETDWRSDAEMASLVADAKAQGTSAQWGRPIYIPRLGLRPSTSSGPSTSTATSPAASSPPSASPRSRASQPSSAARPGGRSAWSRSSSTTVSM